MKKIAHYTFAAITLAVATLPAIASAQVRYQFQAFSSSTSPDSPQSITGSFDLTVPTFITTLTLLPASAFSSCAINNPGYRCGVVQQFDPTGITGYDNINFRFIQSNGNQSGPLYYFEDGAFGSYGTYNSVLLGSSQAGLLTVSAATAVPEPATWAMMLGGFALVGGAMRRRKRQIVAYV